MDNILYIIAGLIVIFLVIVLIMRRNKAQKPAEYYATQAKREGNTLAESGINPDGLTQRLTSHENKFDTLSITQRFIDQQRYDKAIETINRGMLEKPHDNQLSLKLLSIYATINQPDEFYSTYHSIKTHGDSETIAQADDLKALLVGEQPQTSALETMTADDLSTDLDRPDFEGLDLDLLPSQSKETTNHSKAVLATETMDSIAQKKTEHADEPVAPFTDSKPLSTMGTDHNNANPTFDLTLEDLERYDTALVSTATVATTQTQDERAEHPNTTDTDTVTSTVTSVEDRHNRDAFSQQAINDDFDFDFFEQNNASIESPSAEHTDEKVFDKSTLADEAFVLDFSDFATDDASKTPVTVLQEDDFTLALAEEDAVETSVEETSFSLDEDSDAIADTICDDRVNEDKHSLPTMPPPFDSSTLIDDDFNFDSTFDPKPHASLTPMPIEVEKKLHSDNSETTVERATKDADFDTHFAADFDFIKNLDSNQITLELAVQYLQLGEYDSAKRLLSEVMAQGNNEQRNQAQTLLARTA